MAFFSPERPVASQALGGLIFSLSVIFSTAFSGARGAAITPATANPRLVVQRNANPIGSTVFATGASAGVPGAVAKITGVLFSRREIILAGAAGSRARADVAATASATFTMLKNGTLFGTLNFAAAANTATCTVAADTTFDVGDRLTITAPNPADTTLADVFVTLHGRFTCLCHAGWSKNTMRVMARNISGATFDLAAATLWVGVVKRRVP